MQSENTKGFHIALLTIVFLAAFILNFISYGKMGNKQYINQYLHMVLFVFYFIFGIGIQLLSPVDNYMKGSFDMGFHSSAIFNTITKLIFLGALFYTGIIETTTGPALAKTVKDEMGQDVTQEKVLYESYSDYFTFKLLADIFLFVMFLFITVWSFSQHNIIGSIYENKEAINHWGVYVGFGAFTILHFVFQGLRHDILKNFLTDGFQLIPKKLLNFLK
jgi:hypothetical protein